MSNAYLPSLDELKTIAAAQGAAVSDDSTDTWILLTLKDGKTHKTARSITAALEILFPEE